MGAQLGTRAKLCNQLVDNNIFISLMFCQVLPGVGTINRAGF